MHENGLQKFFAHAALFLLPFSALDFGVSFTFGDVFLLLAIALNGSQLMRIQPFQIPFLLAVPFFLLSALTDADGTVVSMVQTIYIFGIVLPFGWTAFTGLTVRRMAQILLLAAVINSVIAVGQSMLVLPMLSSQKTIVLGREIAARGAGLSKACNSLVMWLTPCFLLLPYVRTVPIRVVVLLIMIAGLFASLSKAIILALPGLCFYFWHDSQKRQTIPALLVAALLGGIAIDQFWGLGEAWYRINETADRRLQSTQSSVDMRLKIVDVALDYASECLFFGYGAEAGAHRIAENAGWNTVHVYYLGLVVIAGLPATALLLYGMWMILQGTWQAGELAIAAFVVAHLIACSVMTVLNLSFQSLPLMLAGAVLVRRQRTMPVPQRDPAFHRNFAHFAPR